MEFNNLLFSFKYHNFTNSSQTRTNKSELVHEETCMIFSPFLPEKLSWSQKNKVAVTAWYFVDLSRGKGTFLPGPTTPNQTGDWRHGPRLNAGAFYVEHEKTAPGVKRHLVKSYHRGLPPYKGEVGGGGCLRPYQEVHVWLCSDPGCYQSPPSGRATASLYLLQ